MSSEECPFKKGEIVTHVLGGPQLQILTVHSGKLVECFWFDGLNQPQQKGFAVADLIAAPAPASKPLDPERLPFGVNPHSDVAVNEPGSTADEAPFDADGEDDKKSTKGRGKRNAA